MYIYIYITAPIISPTALSVLESQLMEAMSWLSSIPFTNYRHQCDQDEVEIVQKVKKAIKKKLSDSQKAKHGQVTDLWFGRNIFTIFRFICLHCWCLVHILCTDAIYCVYNWSSFPTNLDASLHNYLESENLNMDWKNHVFMTRLRIYVIS